MLGMARKMTTLQWTKDKISLRKSQLQDILGESISFLDFRTESYSSRISSDLAGTTRNIFSSSGASSNSDSTSTT